MKTMLALILLLPLIFGAAAQSAASEPLGLHSAAVTAPPEDGAVVPLRRGGYRSPRRGYNPGARNPGATTPARPANPARTTNPGTTPAPRTGGFFGGLFGGLALGTIIGSLFNPFAGFSLGFPLLSLLSLGLWIVAIILIVRLFRRMPRGG